MAGDLLEPAIRPRAGSGSGCIPQADPEPPPRWTCAGARAYTGRGERRQTSEPRCIGIDFGTDSVRVVVTRADTGVQEVRAVESYPRWSEGRYCDAAANRFRQHPLDYVESLERACRTASAQLSGAQRDSVIGIGIDAIASTLIAVDEAGTPLALGGRFADNPNAMFVLWKGPHGGARGRRDQRPGAHLGRRRLHLLLGRCLLLGVVLGQGTARAPRRSRGGRGRLVVDRALRLDPRPADRQHRARPVAPRARRGRPQGDVARVLGRPARSRLPGPTRPAARGPARTPLQ